MFDDFRGGLAAWVKTEIGTGQASADANSGLILSAAPGKGYHDGQITDYDVRRGNFRWRPPLRITVRARAECEDGSIKGTAGFGLWNHPFAPDLRGRLPRLPAAIWFFYGSLPHDFRLSPDVQGFGWKAQTIDAATLRAALLAPIALPLMLLMRIPALYRPLYSRISRIMKVGETVLPDGLLGELHAYSLEWREGSARFYVDDQPVLETPFSPTGPLGFVAWIDNQYLIATPQGRFRWGVLPLHGSQRLIVDSIEITSLEGKEVL